ncbi:hypothetical protein RHEC894_CH03253 [Rhizobium sp. CIAT894]|nr:hypothetical protein RHEC894_CH03253 [Rhizobium sp. CIAT894]
MRRALAFCFDACRYPGTAAHFRATCMKAPCPRQPGSAARKAGGVFYVAFPGLTNKNARQIASIGISENFAIEAGRKLG